MKHLDDLESKSIYILREAYFHFSNLAMLWSVGKDSTVLLRLCQKAFFGHIPFPLIHIDTGYKIPQMIEYRDLLTRQWKLNMMFGKNEDALKNKNTFPDKKLSYIQCCKILKTETLKGVIEGKLPRYGFNHQKDKYEIDTNTDPFDAIILGIRADEEGSRSKERYFSPRGIQNEWNISQQPPEFWGQFNTDFPKGTHLRVHPLLDWTEVDIWEYIKRENVPIVDLYFSKNTGKRYRSLGCAPCTHQISSEANTIDEIIFELKEGQLAKVAERSGRAQDKEDRGGLETLRREGYM